MFNSGKLSIDQFLFSETYNEKYIYFKSNWKTEAGLSPKS